MLIKQMYLVLIALLVSGMALAAGETDFQIRANKPGATVKIEQFIKDGKLLVRVNDAGEKPLFGLTASDFSITQAGRTADITSAQLMSENKDVPRHIVMVMDNSFSMSKRNAIQPLLSGVDELLKTVRPIDKVQMVIFDQKKTQNIGGRDLHVKTFSSNQPAELKNFAAKAFQPDELSRKTFLYEALLAGLDLIQKMPTAEPRFMVVFSDGEDLNSSFKEEDVFNVAKGIEQFNVYVIDYMERPETDTFLTKFAKDKNGEIWKAKSETNIVPIFEGVASTMQFYYVVSYQFAPAGKLAVYPESLTVEEVSSMNKILPARIIPSALTLRPVIDSSYGIARWKAVVSNAKGGVAELSGVGPPAAEVNIPLSTVDLKTLAGSGDLIVKMELEDRNGQKLVLTAPPVKLKLVQTRANLAVTPTSLKIEEIQTIDVSPMLGYIFFEKETAEIPPRYVQFSKAEETTGFDEQNFTGTLEKYYQNLNIVGQRLAEKPQVTIKLVGCNDNTDNEKGNKKLSTQRAEAVRDYLKAIWNIAPERMTIEARNLPAKPSSVMLKEGQMENRRVEIVSTDPEILAPIRSIYLATQIDTPALTLTPEVVTTFGIANWKLTIENASGPLADLAGNGPPAKEIKIPLDSRTLKSLGTGGDIVVKMELQDGMKQRIELASEPVKVDFIQSSQLLAQKQDQRVQEKYALILFDFDKDTIGAQNQEIIDKIVARIKKLPAATVEIVGHTDNIGAEQYNQKLSERRALTVYKRLAAAYGEAPGDRIRHSGAGPNNPLFDNASPESRSFNRTVTITLEYLSAE